MRRRLVPRAVAWIPAAPRVWGLALVLAGVLVLGRQAPVHAAPCSGVLDPQTGYCLVTPNVVFASTPTSVSMTWFFAADATAPNATRIYRNKTLVETVPVDDDTPLGPYSYKDDTVQPNTSYAYDVCSAYGGEAEPGRCSAFGVKTAAGPAAPPTGPLTAPTNVQVTDRTQTGATVSWRLGTGATHYQVRCRDTTDGSRCGLPKSTLDGKGVESTLATVTSFSLTKLQPEHRYTIAVCSGREVGGNMPVATVCAADVTFNTPPTPLGAPTNVQVTNPTASGATITWQYGTGGVNNYSVKCRDKADGRDCSTDVPNRGGGGTPTFLATSHTFSTLRPAHIYVIQVCGDRAAGDNVPRIATACSAEQTFRTLPPRPTQVHIRDANAGNTFLELVWTPNIPDEATDTARTEFAVYVDGVVLHTRRFWPGDLYPETPALENLYTVDRPADQATHVYKVCAVDHRGTADEVRNCSAELHYPVPITQTFAVQMAELAGTENAGLAFSDVNRITWDYAARAAAAMCSTRSFVGGHFDGHQTTNTNTDNGPYGLQCSGAGTTGYDITHADMDTRWAFTDVEAVSWAQANRVAERYCATRDLGFVGGHFNGHMLNGKYGLFCYRDGAAWFDATTDEIESAAPGFGFAATPVFDHVPWAQAARAATSFCRGEGFLGGFMTGHNLPGKIGVVCQSALRSVLPTSPVTPAPNFPSLPFPR